MNLYSPIVVLVYSSCVGNIKLAVVDLAEFGRASDIEATYYNYEIWLVFSDDDIHDNSLLNQKMINEKGIRIDSDT